MNSKTRSRQGALGIAFHHRDPGADGGDTVGTHPGSRSLSLSSRVRSVTPPPLAKDWSGVTVERSAEPGPPGQLRVLCGLGRTSAAKPATLRSSVWDLRFYLPLKRPLIPPTGPPPPFSTHRPRPPHALYTRRAPSSVTLLPPSAVQPKRGLGQALGLQGHAVGSTHFHRSASLQGYLDYKKAHPKKAHRI